MCNRETLKRHAGLVDRMANALGIDLEEQMLRGKLSFSQLEDAVLACTGCASADTCDHWLARQESVAQHTPDYCRNAAVFNKLKP